MYRSKLRTALVTAGAALALAAVAAPMASADPPFGDLPDPPTTNENPDVGTVTNGPLALVFRVSDNYEEIPAGHWRVHVYGTWEMTPGSAQNAIDAGYRVRFRLFGADPGADPLLFGPYEYGDGKFGVTATGFWFDDYHLFLPKRGILNEDKKIPFISGSDRDEVYAEVQVIDPNGNVVRSGVTKQETGIF